MSCKSCFSSSGCLLYPMGHLLQDESSPPDIHNSIVLELFFWEG